MKLGRVVTAGANLALLGLIYAVVGLGLIPIVRWVGARIIRQLRSALTLLARAVPLLAIFVLLSFPTQELWQMFSNPTRGVFATIIGLFVVLAVAFLVVRLPREAKGLEREVSVDSPPLRGRQLFNVGLVMFVSQALQVLVVSLMIGAFLTVFGVLAIDDGMRSDWLGSPGDELFSFDLFGGPGPLSMRGGSGDDQLFGTRGNDTNNGMEDNDYLNGLGGYDTLRGGPGYDVCVGGELNVECEEIRPF